MTLTRLLEIDSRLVKPDEFGSVALAERIWRDYGCPTGVRELIDLLEMVLSECRQDGMRYAPILLQREKALRRGTWVPRPECIAAPSGATTSKGDVCSKCGGSGYMQVRGGRGMTLCPCNAWEKQLLRPA
jgi:hypothetical protein